MTGKAAQRPSKRDLTSGSLAGNLFRLAAPLAVGMVLHSFYALADAFWLGRWSKEALAAVGVSMPFLFISISVGMAFGNAGTALVSQYTGAGRHREADRAAGQTLLLLSILSVGVAAPMILLAPQLFDLVRVPGAVAGVATIYFRIVVLALPLTAFAMGYGAALRALGDTITVVIIGACANGLNIVLDPLLIFGWVGLPALGTGGAALASLVSQCLGALACYMLLRRRHAGLHVSLADLKPDWAILRKVMRIGLPLAISNSSTSVGFTVFQTMVNGLGTAVIGAFTLGFRLVHFFQVPSQAMAMAAAPVVGQALGAGKVKLARRAVWVSAALIALVMLLPFAVLMWQGKLVAQAFVSAPDVVEEAGKFFLIVPASSYFFGVLMVLMAAFYGSGHTRPALALAVVRLWLLRLPIAYVLGYGLGWGSIGVYTGMAIGNVLTAVAAFLLFRTRGWQSPVVAAAKPAGERMAPQQAN